MTFAAVTSAAVTPAAVTLAAVTLAAVTLAAVTLAATSRLLPQASALKIDTFEKDFEKKRHFCNPGRSQPPAPTSLGSQNRYFLKGS